MQLISSIVDFLIILLLIRAVFRENEAFLSPVHRLIFRITEPLMKPSKMISQKKSRRIVLTISGLVLLRGLVYMAMTSAGFVPCVGISLLEIIVALLQAYIFTILTALFMGTGMQPGEHGSREEHEKVSRSHSNIHH